MTVKIKTTLICNQCKTETSFMGDLFDYQDEPRPKAWHRISVNTAQSTWAANTPSVGGDFCSMECMRDYLIAAIEKRDNPKPIFLSSPFLDLPPEAK